MTLQQKALIVAVDNFLQNTLPPGAFEDKFICVINHLTEKYGPFVLTVKTHSPYTERKYTVPKEIIDQLRELFSYESYLKEGHTHRLFLESLRQIDPKAFPITAENVIQAILGSSRRKEIEAVLVTDFLNGDVKRTGTWNTFITRQFPSELHEIVCHLNWVIGNVYPSREAYQDYKLPAGVNLKEFTLNTKQWKAVNIKMKFTI